MLVRLLLTLLSCSCLGVTAPIALASELVLEGPLNVAVSDGPHAVELAPVNADEALDAVVVAKRSATYGCYDGNGDGTFGEAVATGPLYLEPTDLVVGDFDGDGLLDIGGINSACT